MEYKPLRLEDYFEQPETGDPEVIAEAAYSEAGEALPPDEPVEEGFDEHEEGYKYGINVVADQAEVEALRESIAQELAGLNEQSERAQEKVRK